MLHLTPARSRSLSALLALSLVSVLGCKSPSAQAPLHVTAHSPSGDVQDDRAALRVSFDQPVVDAKQVGKLLAAPPIKISPALSVAAHWLDRQTLLVTPQAPLAKATRYTVELTGPLAARIDDGFSFEFVHAPFAVQGITGVKPEWLSPEGRFNLGFNQPVAASEVVQRCVLVAKDGSGEVGLAAADPSRIATNMQFTARETLVQGQEYELRCSDLMPASGNAALEPAYTTPMRVYPKPAVASISPASDSPAAPDELKLQLDFATPVAIEQLSKHVHLSPEHPSFTRGWVARGPTSYETQVNLEADTVYTLTIDARMRDHFGQKLGAERTVSFTTTDASASLSLETGIYAIEASGEGFPVWSRNVGAYELSCAYVPPRQIVKVLTGDFSYDPWYSDDQSEELAWKDLELKQKEVSVRPSSSKNKWVRSKIDFAKQCGSGKRGLYLAEFRSDEVQKARTQNGGRYPYRVLGNVTDFGVMLKIGPASGIVWVASLSQAQPVAAAQVSVYDPTGKRVWTGTTDAQGLASLPGSDKLLPPAQADADPFAEESYEGYRDQRLIAVVEKDNDLAVVDGNWANGIQTWNFGFETDRAGGELRVRGFIESDRGIYRPGETVHLKGIAREVPLEGPARVPSAKTVKVHVEDGQGSTLLEKSLALSEFGGFHFDLPLDQNASTGDYYVTAVLGKQTFRQAFSVEEVRPVSFEITTQDAPEHMRLGDKAKVSLEARYLFGAPVTESNVHYEVQRRPHLVHFPAYEAYSFYDWSSMSDWYPWWEPDSYAEFVTEGEGVTDKQGKFSFTVKDTAENVTGATDYLVRATVRDATDQQVTKGFAIAAHPSDFYLGLHAQEWVQAVDMPFAVNMIAVNPKGERVATGATLTLSRERWDCKHTGEPDFRYWAPCERHLDTVSTRQVELTDRAVTMERIVAQQPGEYVIMLSGKDARGNAVTSATSVWVIGKGEAFWSGDESARMPLIASKNKYAPGDTAVLVPQANTEGSLMLVSIERNGIIETRLERADSGSTGIRVPISAAHAPNVYVSVAMVKPRRGPLDKQRPDLKLGLTNLPVSYEQQRLKVEVTTEKADFEPGEEVSGKLRVTGQDGQPVRVEVALSAADEGILQLIAYKTPDPLETFYKPWGLGVDNATNWNRVARLEGQPSDSDEEGADSGGTAQEDRVRSNFVASAYWAPALVTDQNGEVSFTFRAPDNLTAFRLMAVASDAGTRFGSGEQRIRVRKDLLLAPILPRFLLRNDEIELGAVVHNYTDKDGDVDVSFELAGVSPGKKSMRVHVPSNGKGVARFKAKVGEVANAKLKMAASLLDARDALEQTLPVLHPSVTEYATLLEGRAAEANVASVNWPSDLDVNESELEILIDRVGLADLGPSLKYLIQYPYGCLEQTMSGLVPLVKVRDLADSLSLPELKGPKLDTYVRLGVAKVLRHQHADGHFSLWPASNTYPHLTIYALWGLNEARRAGVSVQQRPIDLGLAAIRGWVNAPDRKLGPGDETATMAMAAFVIAELAEPDAALNTRLFEARQALPAYGKAFLLRAMLRAQANPQDVDTLAKELISAISLEGDKAILRELMSLDEHYFSSETRNTAMVLSALLELRQRPDVVEPMVRGLRARRTGGRWASTQDNVYGLVALADYARAEANGKAKVAVRSGDKLIGERTLQGGAILRAHVPLRDLTPGAPLLLSASAPVYYAAVLEKVRPEPKADLLNHGFDVTREYLDYQTNVPVSEIKVGDVIKVRVHVRAREETRYVAISDPFPSGFEPVNTKLATEGGGGSQPYWTEWTHHDLRDERADWFVDDLRAGELRLEYAIRATHAGRFMVPPTHAEEMYTPSFMGHGASDLITVTR